MKIYAVMSHYWDYCNNWYDNHGYYLSKEKAEWECAILEENDLSVGTVTGNNYYVDEIEVNEEEL